eukprot:7099553-Lingulodinium_polyedra.AAC.1
MAFFLELLWDMAVRGIALSRTQAPKRSPNVAVAASAANGRLVRGQFGLNCRSMAFGPVGTEVLLVDGRDL